MFAHNFKKYKSERNLYDLESNIRSRKIVPSLDVTEQAMTTNKERLQPEDIKKSCSSSILEEKRILQTINKYYRNEMKAPSYSDSNSDYYGYGEEAEIDYSDEYNTEDDESFVKNPEKFSILDCK